MATLKQITANRENAQKSTGPRTEEGKSITRLNALQHGLFATDPVIPGEDPAHFEALRASHYDRFHPAAPEEHDDDSTSQRSPGTQGAAITMRGVGVRAHGHPILTDVSLDIPGGSHVAIVGRSGAGKSSVAMLVEQKLLERGTPAYVLDGDNLRHGLNADLGFSMADRSENLRRLAHVATLLADSGQIVLVPVISPLDEQRTLARKVHADAGFEFFEVFCDTPLAECELRDPKGLYAKARAGILKEFTGISDPYEVPADAEVIINTGERYPEEAAQEIILHLEREGFIGVNGAAA